MKTQKDKARGGENSSYRSPELRQVEVSAERGFAVTGGEIEHSNEPLTPGTGAW